MGAKSKGNDQAAIYLLVGGLALLVIQCLHWGGVANFPMTLLKEMLHLVVGVAVTIFAWMAVSNSLKKSFGEFNSALIKLVAIYVAALAAGSVGDSLNAYIGQHGDLIVKGVAALAFFIWLFQCDVVQAGIFAAVMVVIELLMHLFWAKVHF